MCGGTEMACMFDTFEGYLTENIHKYDRCRFEDGHYYLYSSTDSVKPLRLKKINDDKI